MVKIILLLIVFLIPILPLLVSDKPTVEDDIPAASGRVDSPRRSSPRKSYPRWKGPKTDERINRMFAESISLLKELGVPIADSICPEVTLTSAHSYAGCCCARGTRKKYTEYDYYIELSGFALNNTEKSLRSVLIHELIHTVPGGHGHTGEWKKWAKYVNSKTEYHIQRFADPDATPEDRERVMKGGYTS